MAAPSYYGPLIWQGGYKREAKPTDVLLAPPSRLDIVGYQATVLTTALGDFTVPGSDFVWNAAVGAGRGVYLEIIGGATVAGGITAQLYTLAGAAVSGAATAIGGAGASTRARSAALTLVDGTAYQLHFHGTTAGLTAQLRLARLIIE